GLTSHGEEEKKEECLQSRDYRELIREKKLEKKLGKDGGKSDELNRSVHKRLLVSSTSSINTLTSSLSRVPSKLRSSLRSSSALLPNLEEDVCAIAAKEVTPNKCPFGHGTVYSSPYPGYVHGNKKRGVCPNGCRPIVDSDLLEKESPEQTVMREALEFLELYYKERQAEMAKIDGFLSKSERIDQVKTSIETTGIYTHTFDELQHGARVAWRNAPKCSNRGYWAGLKLLDCRHVKSNDGMFDSCLKHLTQAMSTGSSEAFITVFPPSHPRAKASGPQIWNGQLLQYAAYQTEDGVMGDPANLLFTEMLSSRFGWLGPKDGIRSEHDYLPLIIQSSPEVDPELFEIPLGCAPPVHIHHPKHPELSELDMRWYPSPAVCALDLSLGGINYTAVPFNGWYATTEVLRDLTDESRYNMLLPVANILGINMDDNPVWKDEVMAILNKAIHHSFKSAKLAIVDNHTLIDGFYKWYHSEMKTRQYCPVNWKWVIPPMSSSTNDAYLGLNKATEYTLKPAYIVGKSAMALELRRFGRRDTSKAMEQIDELYLACSAFQAFAGEVGQIMRSFANVSFFDACLFDPQKLKVFDLIDQSTVVLFVSSTHGNGDVPPQSTKFFSTLFGERSGLLEKKCCGVLGFGSSAYPVFNGGAKYLSAQLSSAGAEEIVARGECDSVKGEASAVHEWLLALANNLAAMPSSSDLVCKFAKDLKEGSASVDAFMDIKEHLKIDVFGNEEVQAAVGKFFLRPGLRGSSYKSSRRRASLDSMPSFRREQISKRRISFVAMESCERANNHDETEDSPKAQRLMSILQSGGGGNVGLARLNSKHSRLNSVILAREDVIGNDDNVCGVSSGVSRRTSLIKIDLTSCGSPPYQPGDHVRVFPKNGVTEAELAKFVANLDCQSVGLDLKEYVHIEYTGEAKAEEIAVNYPLLHSCLDGLISVHELFGRLVALNDSLSMQACVDLASHASTVEDQTLLLGISKDEQAYESMISICGLEWKDVFTTFPSLCGRVPLALLLLHMKINHPRSYSIASCKEQVGSELHLLVGRYTYSRGDGKLEAGVCSSFLTGINVGDAVTFQIVLAPSFHHPLDSSCPVIFVCTGTGFAPMRGLLQQRDYLLSRGEKLGKSFLVFGSRSSDEGLFHDEISDYSNRGILNVVSHVYSREPGRRKQYVTDELNSFETRDVLLQPMLSDPKCHVFICGSANMAESTKQCLRDMSPFFDSLAEEGRLHCDVFGAVSSSKPPSAHFATAQ
ncbi:hypothetical protein THAOC_24946, partial [Thalassiosira oceanica]